MEQAKYKQNVLLIGLNTIYRSVLYCEAQPIDVRVSNFKERMMILRVKCYLVQRNNHYLLSLQYFNILSAQSEI